ncbi:MAG: lipopolysaccharide kinase InaA family protein [Acidobacteriota bacterium]
MSGFGATKPLVVDDLHGEVAERYAGLDWRSILEPLVDAGSAKTTLHWGRNYLYVAELSTPDETFDVVVKQFRHDSLKPRLRRAMRGTKAARSWQSAEALTEAGLATPEPVLYVDHAEADGPAFYVCRYDEDRMEARYLLRALNADRASEEFPDLDAARFLGSLGAALGQLHDAGIWHRDMTSGNVLLSPTAFSHAQVDPGTAPPLTFIDLSRARCGRSLSLSERMRDLSRMPIFRAEDQQIYLDAYFERAGLSKASRSLGVGLYRFYHRSFLLKNSTKKTVRGGLRSVLETVLPRRSAHTHIPEADASASRRDKIVWDNLSDQPHQHASRFEKTLVRLGDSPRHLSTAAAVLTGAPQIRRRFKEIVREPRIGAPFVGAGVALRPYPGDREGLLSAVEDLGVRHALLRLHPWEDEHEEELVLARELEQRGIELSFALPQNRVLVKDPERWRASVRRLATTFAPFGRAFQVGQAINRSKWGVWHPGEYLQLLASAAEELRAARSDVEILGPPIIDFEFHLLVALLSSKNEAAHFDAVASLLYVDRRGAPENLQMGLDTVGKVELLKSIAETSRNCPSGRVWITEMNWPLREGPHSPAGRDVAVGEDEQADYLVRYYVLVLATGLVERVFWWQPIAKGYGLIDPTGDSLRRRPSFYALRDLLRHLRGRTYAGRLDSAEDVHLHRFVGDNASQVLVAWTTASERRSFEPPGGFVALQEIGGDARRVDGTLELGRRPIFLLSEEAVSAA